MNFFEDQRLAKKKSQRLTFLFYVVVLSVGVLTSLFISLAFAVGLKDTSASLTISQLLASLTTDHNIKILQAVTICVTIAILARSYWEVTLLKAKPQSICEAMGARLVSVKSKNFKEQQYVNIVEEMSIASSVPVPLIYVLDDDAINAFACGYDINSAAICVTTGCMNRLTRDELQAVVAHEFSHILNGDMTINLKLIGMLAGLILIYQAGFELLRGTSRRRSKKGDAGYIGLGLMVIGGLGYLGGALLKAAISRQREYLADASSVQFTRNPDGIVGALKKIYVNSEQGLLASPKAQKASHMFLVDGVGSFFSFSTHPPLFDRIKAVDRNFNPRRFEDRETEKILEEMQKLESQDHDSGTSSERANTSLDQAKVQEKLREILPLFLMYKKHNDYKGLVMELVSREKEEFKNLSPDQLEVVFEKLAGELRRLTDNEREEILKELIGKVNEGGKISFYEFLVVAYLKPALQDVKVEDMKISEREFEKLSHIMLSFFYFLDDNSNTEIDFSPLDKRGLSYGKILGAIEILRFAKPEKKKLFVEKLKKLANANEKINAKEKVVFRLLCQTLSIPGIVLED